MKDSLNVSRISMLLNSVKSNAVLNFVFLTRSETQAWDWRDIFVESVVGKLFLGTFRGIGQVAFVNSAVTGVCIYIGCSVSNPLAALLGLISTFICTCIGLALPRDREAARDGLIGYNGFLVGMGLGYFNNRLSSNRSDWLIFALLSVPLLFATALCWSTHMALRKSLSTPPLTFAYNIALSCWLALAACLGSESDYFPSFLEESTQTRIEYSLISIDWFLRSSAAGVGQVFFAPEFTPSLIIILGIGIGSPIAAILGLFGSMVGTSIAVLLHLNLDAANAGVYGFSAALAAISLGGYYFVLSFASVMLALFASVLTVAVSFVFDGLLVNSGPSLTFPFCAVATVVILAARDIGTPVFVGKERLISCESHFAGSLDKSPEQRIV